MAVQVERDVSGERRASQGRYFWRPINRKKEKKMLEDKVKEAIMYKTMFGLVKCDIHVPKEKTFFAKMTAISKKVEVEKKTIWESIHELCKRDWLTD